MSSTEEVTQLLYKKQFESGQTHVMEVEVVDAEDSDFEGCPQ